MVLVASMALTVDLLVPCGKPTTAQTPVGTGWPRSMVATRPTQTGATQTVAQPSRIASVATRWTSALVASGLRIVWSIFDASSAAVMVRLPTVTCRTGARGGGVVSGYT